MDGFLTTELYAGIAIYQTDAIAEIFSTLGYLVPIITVLAVPIMPRAKFIQTMILNTLGICIGSVSDWGSLLEQHI